jgi:hypothetical protein
LAELDLGSLELELGICSEELELELGTSSEELEGSSSSLEEDKGTYSLELLGIATIMLELELEGFGSSGILSLLELDSSWSPQKTSNKLSFPSLHPKTATTKARANKNKRILAI